jgi:hypothetical protein
MTTGHIDEQKLRRETLENDLSVRQQQSGTFHAFALADVAAEMQGRHGADPEDIRRALCRDNSGAALDLSAESP